MSAMSDRICYGTNIRLPPKSISELGNEAMQLVNEMKEEIMKVVGKPNSQNRNEVIQIVQKKIHKLLATTMAMENFPIVPSVDIAQCSELELIDYTSDEWRYHLANVIQPKFRKGRLQIKYICGSDPDEFFIHYPDAQLNKLSICIRETTERIRQEFGIECLENVPEVDMVCVAILDRNYHRARVTSVTSIDKIQVQLIDEGNIATVPLKYLMPIDKSAAKLPVMCLKCHVPDYNPHLFIEPSEEFQNLMRIETVEMRIRARNPRNYEIVDSKLLYSPVTVDLLIGENMIPILDLLSRKW